MVNKVQRTGMRLFALDPTLLMFHRTPSPEILRELSDSRYTVYDVLPAFFLHADPVVTLGLSFLLVDHLLV